MFIERYMRRPIVHALRFLIAFRNMHKYASFTYEIYVCDRTAGYMCFVSCLLNCPITLRMFSRRRFLRRSTISLYAIILCIRAIFSDLFNCHCPFPLKKIPVISLYSYIIPWCFQFCYWFVLKLLSWHVARVYWIILFDIVPTFTWCFYDAKLCRIS